MTLTKADFETKFQVGIARVFLFIGDVCVLSEVDKRARKVLSVRSVVGTGSKSIQCVLLSKILEGGRPVAALYTVERKRRDEGRPAPFVCGCSAEARMFLGGRGGG